VRNLFDSNRFAGKYDVRLLVMSSAKWSSLWVLPAIRTSTVIDIMLFSSVRIKNKQKQHAPTHTYICMYLHLHWHDICMPRKQRKHLLQKLLYMNTQCDGNNLLECGMSCFVQMELCHKLNCALSLNVGGCNIA